ncbi:MAG: DEAD/DEAH box helicase [Propionibacteriaceae bacterium]|nr:DEAD/DEAH box helicase [Propionibacteriaceae bacterium]
MSLTEFRARLNFSLDDYQVEACQHLEAGRGVLVAAPTGAGKTVVGEFAVDLAVEHGAKCFYTTPIKALSNQKFRDLCLDYGSDKVGLLTGDQVVNGGADIIVMTTEVLRNMIYAGSSALRGLEFVVMDEVHYLSDRFRGPVWEEIILSLDRAVKIVGLSATVSNVEEFGAWLSKVRGDMATVVSERRPVPLYQHVFAGKRLLDLYDAASSRVDGPGPKVNPELTRLAVQESRVMRDDSRRLRAGSGRGKRGTQSDLGARPHGRWATRSHLVPRRSTVVTDLARLDLLPAIYFIFSRQGCDQAVSRLVDDGVWLTTASQREALAQIAARHAVGLSLEDLEALHYHSWLEAFTRGIAAHHAGLLPVFKQAVEEAFTLGLVKVVFATETLALGINMPARTVVLDKLVKYNGAGHVDITPGEYTQLTGRAGRRGIDVEGHAVVTWQAGLDPRALAGLASRRTYPLRSAFAPTYNMAVNLIASMGVERARRILQDSFAQFHTDQTRPSQSSRSLTLVAKFESIRLVLESLGYIESDPTRVTPVGGMLTRLYGSHDLLTAEAIRAGVFDPLPVPSLAAVLSTLVYEPRLTDRRLDVRMPDQASTQAITALRQLWRELRTVEKDHRLEPTTQPETGFAKAAHLWATGATLGQVVEWTGLSAGDFVRWVRQCVDCAGQIADAVKGTALADRCHEVVRAMRRGVVDIDMTEE